MDGCLDAMSVLMADHCRYADHHGVTCDHRLNHQTHRPVDYLGGRQNTRPTRTVKLI